MLKFGQTSTSRIRPYFMLMTALVTLAACGIGMDAEDRLLRGQEAFDAADYRAASIDVKNVLLEEPDNTAARLLLGKISVAVGDGAAAEKELRKAIELGADPGGLVVELGQALLFQGKYDDVLAEILPEMAQSDTERMSVLRIRGDALIGLRRPEEAREAFEAVLRADNDDILAQLGIVNTFISEQNFPQARETLNQVLGFDDGFVKAWLTSGSLNMVMRDAERAASDFQRAVELSRAAGNMANEMQALSGLSNAALSLNDLAQAESVLARMREIGGADTRTILLSARVASANADWATAQKDLQEVLRRAPDYRPAQFLLGVAHKESGNLSQSEMYLSAVVAAAPDNADARRLLAETRLLLGEADEARQTLAPIIQGDDADMNSLSMAAQASLNLGAFSDATELLERGVAAEPGNIDLQLQLAFALFQSGNSEGAENILKNLPAGATDRNELQRDSLLVLTQLAKGELASALQDAHALVQLWPDRYEPHNLAGAIEIASADLAAARQSFSTAAALAPDNPVPVRFLARLDELDGDTDSARDRYLTILEMLPNDVQSMVSLAKLAAMAEAMDESQVWLEKARSADSAAVTPRRILAAMHLSARDYAAAETVAREAYDLNQNDANLANLLGQARYGLGDYNGAESSFGRAVELDATQPSYRLNMARTQAQLGDSAGAIATLSEPPGQYLEHISNAVLLASLKVNSGAADEAVQIAAELADRNPESAVPIALQAELLARDGELVQAADLYEKALQIEVSDRYAIRAYQIRVGANLPDPVRPLVTYLNERPLDSNVRAFLAQTYQSSNDYQKSIAEYEQVLNANPENFVVLNNLAWNYLESGDPRAEEVARRAYEIKPDNSSVVDTLGWIMVRNGTLTDGIAMLRNAVKLNADSEEIRYHLAAALAQAGESSEAQQLLSDILSGDAEFSSRTSAEKLLAELRAGM